MNDGRGDEDIQLSAEWETLTQHPQWWLLLSGNRLLIAGIVLLAVFIGLWGAVVTGYIPLHDRTATLYLLLALISGNFTLITIVVSLSQFILTRHLESPGEIREKVTDVLSYRQEVGETTHQSVISITPSDFLLMLFESLHHDLRSLEEQEWATNEERQHNLNELLVELSEHINSITADLEGSNADFAFALFRMLSTNYARYIYIVWYIQFEYEEQLSESTNETVERIVTTIEHIDVARRLFKSTFIQSELAVLSRRLLYIGFPALISTIVLLLLFTARTATPISPPVLSVVLPIVVTVGLAPIVVLGTYILRLATLTEYDIAMYSFTTPFD